jgi:ElaB/YqjD/DUF883 family membrane-anchored ribosome-binding protein
MAFAKESTAETLRAGAAQAGERLRETAGQARHELEPWLRRSDQTARRLAAEHPLAMIAGAMVAGYVVGRALARR